MVVVVRSKGGWWHNAQWNKNVSSNTILHTARQMIPKLEFYTVHHIPADEVRARVARRVRWTFMVKECSQGEVREKQLVFCEREEGIEDVADVSGDDMA